MTQENKEISNIEPQTSNQEQADSVQQDIDSNFHDNDKDNNSNEAETLTAESVTEAVLFASDESLTAARLANIVGTEPRQIRQHIENLNDKYKTNNNAFRIERIAGGYQMLTLSPYITSRAKRQ